MLHTSGPRILALGLDLDRLLGTDRHFARLRGWIDSARAFGADGAERDWLEYNARLQITLWGSVDANHALLAGCKPAFSHLCLGTADAKRTAAPDASKQWHGLVGDYHVPQWRHFLQRMGDAAASGQPNPYAEVQKELLAMAVMTQRSFRSFESQSRQGFGRHELAIVLPFLPQLAAFPRIPCRGAATRG